MNPLVLFLASGNALYPGILLLIAAAALTYKSRNPWRLRLRNLAAAIALAMIAFTGPPAPLWLVLPFFAAFAAWFILWNLRPTPHLMACRVLSISAMILGALALGLAELPYLSMPALPSNRADHLAVIGDSLSAGIETARIKPWPAEFQRLTGIPVRNLSQAGAQVADGPDLAKRLSPDDTLVLIELGGNDLIANLPAADFERGLTVTLNAISGPTASLRTLVMFELPLLPHKAAYGRIQRRLAAQYHVTLIPKRHLTEVLGTPDATSDGLHLAPAGAHKMAELIAEKLTPALQIPSATLRTTAPSPVL